MSSGFDAVDPRGNIVRCDDDCISYILRKRPTLHSYLKDIKRAIEAPNYGCIFRSNNPAHAERAVYYGYVRGWRAEMRVVVAFSDGKPPFLVSAHPCSKRPSGEEMIWPITNP